MKTKFTVLVVLVAAFAVGIGAPPAAAALTCAGLTPTITGGSGGDHLVGTLGRDVFWAGNGHDTIVGLGGDDVICPGFGFDRIIGGPGFDVVDYSGQGTPPSRGVLMAFDAGVAVVPTHDFVGTEIDVFVGLNGVIGTPGNDVFTGSVGDDLIVGLGGDDRIEGGLGDDHIDGGDGDDQLLANAAVQVDPSDAPPLGDDVEDDDLLLGGNGNDVLSATLDNASVNRMFGGAGDDTLKAFAGNDYLDGGAGTDTVTHEGSGLDLEVDLSISGCQQTGEGCDTFVGVEALVGGSGADTFRGNSVNNDLDGGPGDDVIDGGAGVDLARGGDGIDTCVAETRLECEV